jgi:DNA-binding NarL/FixJ family response regulator
MHPRTLTTRHPLVQGEISQRRMYAIRERNRTSATLIPMASVLIASDLASLRRELETMIAGPDVLIEEASSGPEVIERVKRGGIDLVVADLQIGAMGAMAITMELHNLESYGGADSVAVLMLLDRRPDVFLARRSGADGFVVKPLDPQRVRAAVRALLAGETYEDDSLRPATVRVGSPDA